MFKQLTFLLLIGLFAAGYGDAQTLFSYGDKQVSKEEFLKAFAKNNTEKAPTEKTYRAYLDLYVRFKLKVQAAYDMRLDTLTSQKTELQNFRNQVADNYVTDKESMDRLAKQAFDRSQHDIHLAHIFIALPKNANAADSSRALQKAQAAHHELEKGVPFAQVAMKYSDDSTAKNNHGDIGFITVFTLPYELENLAYGTPPGKFSKIFASRSGYHIFKNLGERKAIGKIKAAHILLAFPPHATEAMKAQTKQKADSIENLLRQGAPFGELAKKFSMDNLSYQNNGEIAEFGVGKYDRAFEDAAFGLKNDGDFTAPVRSSFGYHIIKRLGRLSVPATPTKEAMDVIRRQVSAEARSGISKKILLQRILAQTGFKRAPVDENSLRLLTDSFLDNRPASSVNGLNNQTVLYSFPDKNILVGDWLTYVRTARNVPRLSNNKTQQEILAQYLQTVAFEYYRNHLEDYNPEFAYQLSEFREGNMLFEIMQRKVWNQAASDTSGLKNYFQANQNHYWWDPSADAVVFTCNNESTANSVKQKLSGGIAVWKKLQDGSDGSMQADSGRFLLTQLPVPEQKSFTEGAFTSLATNPPDNTVTFAYIVKIHHERSPRSFLEARGMVTNDYQNYLEDKWVEQLKMRYPVKINETVLGSLK